MLRYINKIKINTKKYMLDIKIELKIIEKIRCLTSLILDHVKIK